MPLERLTFQVALHSRIPVFILTVRSVILAETSLEMHAPLNLKRWLARLFRLSQDCDWRFFRSYFFGCTYAPIRPVEVNRAPFTQFMSIVSELRKEYHRTYLHQSGDGQRHLIDRFPRSRSSGAASATRPAVWPWRIISHGCLLGAVPQPIWIHAQFATGESARLHRGACFWIEDLPEAIRIKK